MCNSGRGAWSRNNKGKFIVRENKVLLDAEILVYKADILVNVKHLFRILLHDMYYHFRSSSSITV